MFLHALHGEHGLGGEHTLNRQLLSNSTATESASERVRREANSKSEPLLATKLYIPPVRPQLVPRPRLLQQLDEGLQRTPGVTLISAPAGFGKTTLVSEWVARSAQSVAWLSLDEGDSDITRFLTYFTAALQTIEAEIGTEVLRVLSQSQPPQRIRC